MTPTNAQMASRRGLVGTSRNLAALLLVRLLHAGAGPGRPVGCRTDRY